MFTVKRDFFISLLLVGTTLAVFWQVVHCDFTTYDDNQYVTENRRVQTGLTPQNVAWAFTSCEPSYWMPTIWLSFMLDFEIYGLNPSGYHLTNLFLHIANTLLLFLIFKRMTGAVWKSAFVAALFALHPLHVESVAWVAERKDVLSTLFWMLTLWTYLGYVERPAFSRYLLPILFFALGLMAKPMLVTVPFILLLLDYWPLERFQPDQWVSGNGTPNAISQNHPWQKSSSLRLVLEKVPFFVLATITSVVTFFVQHNSGAAKSLELHPLKDRIANGLVSYASYIGKMIWPQNLAVFYPHPGSGLPLWQIVGATLLLAAVFILAIRAARRHPFILVGWLWYLGTLVPAIGLVQSGDQAMADRFTYVPLIGLFIIIAWGVPRLIKGWHYRRIVLISSSGALLLVLAICTTMQLRHWKNDITLFTHALKVTENNFLAHNNLGSAIASQGRYEEATTHFMEALRISPNHARAHYNLALALAKQGRLGEAIAHYSDALRLRPDYPEALNGLGVALARQGKLKDAIAHFNAALQVKPDYAPARGNLDLALEKMAKTTKTPVRHQNPGP